MMDEYGRGGVEMFDTWHIFGDPSLRVVGSVAVGMGVSPGSGLVTEGMAGGPFDPNEMVYTVRNLLEEPLDYTVSSASTWVVITNGSGTLASGAEVEVTVSLGAEAYTFGQGHYESAVEFVNETTHDGDALRSVVLDVGRTIMDVASVVRSGDGGSDGRPVHGVGDVHGNERASDAGGRGSIGIVGVDQPERVGGSVEFHAVGHGCHAGGGGRDRQRRRSCWRRVCTTAT